jgi:hypothetical protein
MARGKFFLVRGVHYCPILFYLSCQTSVSTLWRTCVYIHISYYVQTVHELPLLPNNTVVKHFYTNRERWELLTGYLSLGYRRGGDWTNTWHWTNFWHVYVLVLTSSYNLGSLASRTALFVTSHRGHWPSYALRKHMCGSAGCGGNNEQTLSAVVHVIYVYRLYFINVWPVYEWPKTYTWSGTFILKDGRYFFTIFLSNGK